MVAVSGHPQRGHPLDPIHLAKKPIQLRFEQLHAKG
jgi:hypothetical protein